MKLNLRILLTGCAFLLLGSSILAVQSVRNADRAAKKAAAAEAAGAAVRPTPPRAKTAALPLQNGEQPWVPTEIHGEPQSESCGMSLRRRIVVHRYRRFHRFEA